MKNLPSPLKLHLGCGNFHIEGFINIDVIKRDAVDMVLDLSKPLPFEEVDQIESYHMIEHFNREEADAILKDWYKALKKGGKLVLELPDIVKLAKWMVEESNNETVIEWIYGKQDNQYEVHKWGYSPWMMENKLNQMGFKNVQVMPAKDYHASLSFRVEAIK